MRQHDPNVIHTQGLSKRFGAVQALQGVDLAGPKNSIFGFLGPNGAGNTTLMKVQLGLIRPTAGSGTIFGHDIVGESVAIRERIGYLPQQPRFIDYMTARENLMFTARFFFTSPAASLRNRCDEMLAANALPLMLLLIGVPAVLGYTLLSLCQGGFFPWQPFLSGVGIMMVHTLFYLTLTLALGTLFNNRGPILGIALASALGGSLVGGLFQPALYVTPWLLPDVAVAVAAGQPVPSGMGTAPIVATVVWTLVFILAALIKFERTEF